MRPQPLIVGTPKGLRYAHTMRWTGVPRVNGVQAVATATGRLGWAPARSPARACGEAAGLRRERARLRNELGARQVVQAQLGARLRDDDRRLVTVGEHCGRRQ